MKYEKFTEGRIDSILKKKCHISELKMQYTRTTLFRFLVELKPEVEKSWGNMTYLYSFLSHINVFQNRSMVTVLGAESEYQTNS